MAAQMNAGGAAVIGHGTQVLFENLEINDHAGGREIVSVKVLKIAADDAGLDFVKVIGRAGGKGPRRSCEQGSGSAGAQETSSRCHGQILPQVRAGRLARL